jgi:cyclopropane-fatty-acyl-phospholipid synthase
MTLRYWVRRLEANHEQAVKASDETTYRIWRLYMSGSAHGFHTGRLNVYQALLIKSEKSPSGLPLTRGDWYSRI